MKKFLLAAAAALLTGCASNQLAVVGTIAPQDKILVVSKFDDDFAVRRVGTTVFQNDASTLDTQSWHVDDYIESTVVSMLEPAYAVIQSTEFRDELTVPSGNFVTGFTNPIEAGAALDIARQLGARYILLISPIDFQDAYFRTNQMFGGHGLYQRTYWGKSETIHFVQMSMELFDALSGEFIATNGTIGHKDGDSVWIIHEDVSNLQKTDLEDIDHDTDMLKERNEKLLKTLVGRSLEFMTFQVTASE